MTKLSAAQIKTLTTIIANGGEMNGYAGQRGFYCNSLAPLKRMGLIEQAEKCEPCTRSDSTWSVEDCLKPISGPKGPQYCYQPVRVTEAGRKAVEAPAAANEPAVVVETIEQAHEVIATEFAGAVNDERRPSGAQRPILVALADLGGHGTGDQIDNLLNERGESAPGAAEWSATKNAGWVTVKGASVRGNDGLYRPASLWALTASGWAAIDRTPPAAPDAEAPAPAIAHMFGQAVRFVFAAGEVTLPLCALSQIQRSTGTMHDPEQVRHLPADLVARISDLAAPPAGPVVGLLVNTFSRKATAVGPFETPGSAVAYWEVPFNRLKGQPESLFIIAQMVDDDTAPQFERAVCRYDGRPIARLAGQTPPATWYHCDHEGGVDCGIGTGGGETASPWEPSDQVEIEDTSRAPGQYPAAVIVRAEWHEGAFGYVVRYDNGCEVWVIEYRVRAPRTAPAAPVETRPIREGDRLSPGDVGRLVVVQVWSEIVNAEDIVVAIDVTTDRPDVDAAALITATGADDVKPVGRGSGRFWLYWAAGVPEVPDNAPTHRDSSAVQHGPACNPECVDPATHGSDAEVCPDPECMTCEPAQVSPVDDPDVWVSVPRKGIEYHDVDPDPGLRVFTECMRSTRTGEVMPRSEAVERYQAKPCPRCVAEVQRRADIAREVDQIVTEVEAQPVKYNPDTDRYETPDGVEDPGCRSRRLVEESSPAALWGDR